MRKKIILIFLYSLVLVGCAGTGQFWFQQSWAERTLKKLTLREKIAQMMVYHTNMRFMNSESAKWKEIKSLITSDGIGGLHIWFGDAGTSITLLNEIQWMSKIPILVDADIESGLGRRYPSGTDLPPLMAIAATGNPHYAFEAGRIAAEESRAVGIHFNLSPVVDVNNNPKNPIINTRSFGEDPDSVTLYATQFIRGLQDHGMLATAKHFPGHGDTETDSHSALAQIPSDSSRLWSIELPPFKAAIDAGVEAVMVAHVNAPDFQPHANNPATLSVFWMQDILRAQLGFKGVIITDAMDMGGVTRNYSDDYALIATIRAGADVILQNHHFKESVDIVEKAVLDGLISEERINESALRMLKMKERAGLHLNRFVSIDYTRATVGKIANRKLATEIAAKAITLVKNEQNLLPLNPEVEDTLYLVDLYDYNNNHSESTFTKLLKSNGRHSRTFQIDKSDSSAVWKDILDQIPTDGYVFLNAFANPTPNKDEIFLPESELNFVNALLKKCPRVVVTSFGSPYLILAFPETDTYLCAYKSSGVMQRAAAEVLKGNADIRGILPVTIPNIAERGSGIKIEKVRWKNGNFRAKPGLTLKKVMPYEVRARINVVQKLMQSAIADSAWPGAVLLAAKEGKIFLHESFGYHTYHKNVPTTRGDIFDLASITKVIATTSAIMKLYEQEQLDLDEKVVKYLPDFRGRQPVFFNQKEEISIKNLLTHSSGLPPGRGYFLVNGSVKTRLDSLFNTEPELGIAEKMVYSDIGLITLGKVIERITSLSLGTFVDSLIFQPLRMSSTYFNPPADRMKRIVPTEYSSAGDGFIKGFVHDENSHSMGGVTGHAGLFSTAQNLAIFSQMMLNDGIYGWTRIFKPETVEKFTRRAQVVKGSSRCLGWDSPSGKASGGVYLSDDSFGHTGFTGTSLWIDPENDIFVILLTNAVHPYRRYKTPNYYDWRQKIHSAVYESVGITERNPKLKLRDRWDKEEGKRKRE